MTFAKLNNIIGNEIERLSEMDVFANGAEMEIERGKTLARLTKAHIDSNALALKIEEFKARHNKTDKDLPSVLVTD